MFLSSQQGVHIPNIYFTNLPDVTTAGDDSDDDGEDEDVTDEPDVMMVDGIDVTMVTRVGAEPTEEEV
jgi:hypothetical protein